MASAAFSEKSRTGDGGAQGDVRMLRKRATPHGFVRIHKNINDGTQDFSVSLGKFRGLHSEGLPSGCPLRSALVWHSGKLSTNLCKLWGHSRPVKPLESGGGSVFRT